MRWMFRPSTLMLIVGILVVGAAGVIYFQTRPVRAAAPIPVETGEQEIAWLHPATSPEAWRRFVDGIQSELGNKAQVDEKTFPDQTAAIPELRIRLPGARDQLILRWYKLTSDLNTAYWVRELLEREPPPLAIIGGSNSESAARLASELKKRASALTPAQRPLLLLTTATADEVNLQQLIDIYKDRTFRFSFTNQQMCEAVLNFIWQEPTLKPDSLPAYSVYWEDDPYSADLLTQFIGILRNRKLSMAASQVGLQAGVGLSGGWPWSGLAIINQRHLRTPTFVVPFAVPWSGGAYDRPNQVEAEAARFVLDEMERRPWQQRPLLFLPAGAKPARRFLRALDRFSPTKTRNFVIATGDAIGFNTIFRDRDIAWPIQDMPCHLVQFNHHNPIDIRAGFGELREGTQTDPHDRELAGTNDKLLYQSIAKSLYLSANSPEGPIQSAFDLGKRFQQLRWQRSEGVTFQTSAELLFQGGNRRSGTGEHIIWLQPKFQEDRVLPQATIRVYSRERAGSWVPYKDDLSESLLNHIPYTGADIALQE